MNVMTHVAAAGGREPLIASLLAGDSREPYAMFGVRELTAQGAFLVGPFFLEVDEVFTVKLAPEGGSAVQLEARVVALRDGAEGEPAGMSVALFPADDAARARLDELAAASGASAR